MTQQLTDKELANKLRIMARDFAGRAPAHQEEAAVCSEAADRLDSLATLRQNAEKWEADARMERDLFTENVLLCQQIEAKDKALAEIAECSLYPKPSDYPNIDDYCDTIDWLRRIARTALTPET